MQYKKPIKKTFDSPIILVGGGILYHKNLLKQRVQQGWPVIAADGGLNNLQPLGVIADLMIGDGDSCPADTGAILHIHYHEQTTTDFEKCLYTLEAPLIVAFGFTGKRFDHSLAALHALQRYGRAQKLVMVDEVDCFSPFSQPIKLELKRDVRVSVYPLSPTRFVASRGLAYPLNGLTLSQGDRIGCSNVSTEATVSIIPDTKTGVSLLVLPVVWLDQLQQGLIT